MLVDYRIGQVEQTSPQLGETEEVTLLLAGIASAETIGTAQLVLGEIYHNGLVEPVVFRRGEYVPIDYLSGHLEQDVPQTGEYESTPHLVGTKEEVTSWP